MKNIFAYTLAIVAIIFSACNQPTYSNLSTRSLDNSTPKSAPQTKNENGECFAKVLFGAQYETEIKKEYVFTGDPEMTSVDLEEKTLELKPGKTEWIKKKADKNCLSADPNDCLVWCLVEIPAEVEKYYLVKDITQTEEYEIKEFEVEKLVRKGGYTEERQVVCDDLVSEKLIAQLHDALIAKGYRTGSKTKLDARLKSALTQFQKKNKLPIGQLDFETMDVLGIVVGG